MTCKDCIHYDVCVVADGIEYATEEALKADCPHFKNKADFVEVVRCKDCVKRGTFDCVKSKGDRPTTTKNEEFCCWGERRKV